MEIRYTTSMHRNSIGIEEYLEGYVNVEEFLEYCKKCPNYKRLWTCPTFDFDVIEYWKQFKTLEIIGVKIEFDSSMLERAYTPEETNEIIRKSQWKEKIILSDLLLKEEKQYDGSVSLGAGCCHKCGADHCRRKWNQPCCNPNELRYSIEALGGNVGLTASKVLGIELAWMEEGKLPPYFVLVAGMLHK